MKRHFYYRNQQVHECESLSIHGEFVGDGKTDARRIIQTDLF